MLATHRGPTSPGECLCPPQCGDRGIIVCASRPGPTDAPRVRGARLIRRPVSLLRPFDAATLPSRRTAGCGLIGPARACVSSSPRQLPTSRLRCGEQAGCSLADAAANRKERPAQPERAKSQRCATTTAAGLGGGLLSSAPFPTRFYLRVNGWRYTDMQSGRTHSAVHSLSAKRARAGDEDKMKPSASPSRCPSRTSAPGTQSTRPGCGVESAPGAVGRSPG